MMFRSLHQLSRRISFSTLPTNNSLFYQDLRFLSQKYPKNEYPYQNFPEDRVSGSYLHEASYYQKQSSFPNAHIYQPSRSYLKLKEEEDLNDPNNLARERILINLILRKVTNIYQLPPNYDINQFWANIKYGYIVMGLYGISACLYYENVLLLLFPLGWAAAYFALISIIIPPIFFVGMGGLGIFGMLLVYY